MLFAFVLTTNCYLYEIAVYILSKIVNQLNTLACSDYDCTLNTMYIFDSEQNKCCKY